MHNSYILHVLVTYLKNHITYITHIIYITYIININLTLSIKDFYDFLYIKYFFIKFFSIYKNGK